MACGPQARNFLGSKMKNDIHIGYVDDCHVDLNKEKYGENSSMNSSSESNKLVHGSCSSSSLLANPLNDFMFPAKLDKITKNVHFEDFKPSKITKPTKKLDNNNNKIKSFMIINNSLDLSSRGLAAIPNLKDKNIKELMLQDNKLDRLDNFPILLQLERCFLQRNSISFIPIQLGKCAELTILDVRFNRITVIPDCLCELPNLELLILSSNKIECIPDSIQNLQNLKHLGVDNNKISRIPPVISKLARLTSLNLSFNRLDKIPEEICNCACLRILDIMHNRLTELPDLLGNLSSLNRLNIRNNRITNIPASLMEATNLKEFSIEENCVETLPDQFLCLVKCNDSVNLSRNSFKAFPCGGPKQFSTTTSLNLSNNYIDCIPMGIFSLSKYLRVLNLKGNEISTLIPNDIVNWTTLEELDLSLNQLNVIPSEIGALVNLQKLHLSSNHIKKLPPTIGNLSALTILDLDDNKIESLPDEIGNLSSLIDFNLTANEVKNLPSTIGNLKALTIFRLGENDLRSVPPEIGEMSSLVELHLTNNINLDNLPDELTICEKLKILSLANCGLKNIPEQVRSQGLNVIIYFLSKVYTLKHNSNY